MIRLGARLAVLALGLGSAAAQMLADLPRPTPYPDLQIEGEWWFYKLLDAQFPHDIVKLLPPEAVNGNHQPGQPLFTQLPDASYVMLEFFAPWCPHCQHFAPELVRAVQHLQQAKDPATGKQFVEVRAVDCERLELKVVCEWAQAAGYPKIIVAPRATLLGPLPARAEGVQGLAGKFPVESGLEVMDFLAVNVPNMPQLPPLPPPAQNTPFFGWALPPEGVTEPPTAPVQDLSVGVASLLHEAFSTMDFAPEKKSALFDLLQLLCVAGPGGDTCRSSACAMRASLEQEWDSLITQATISHDEEYTPITPFTVTHLDFARVEHEHRWCNRPWPDFASESWSWCMGRTPGARGYTCGLWMVFHSLLAGADDLVSKAGDTALASLPQPPVEIVRGTVASFFACQSCRDHFLAIPISPTDKATTQAQMLWLWSAHNQATARIAVEDLQHNPNAPPRGQWPSPQACPTCQGLDGQYDTVEVVKHIQHFYGGALYDSSQGGAGGAPAIAGAVAAAPVESGATNMAARVKNGAQATAASASGFMHKLIGKYEQPRVHVQIFYFTVCPHCELFFKLGLKPFIEAQLPGDLVTVSILPIYPPILHALKMGTCLQEDDCRLSLAPLCALKKMVAGPMGADDADLLKGANFAACDIGHTAEGQGRQAFQTKQCAQSASLMWEGQGGLAECAEGEEGMQLMKQGAENVLLKAMEQLHNKDGFTEPPSMPWVFVDGKMLSCGPFGPGDGATCNAEITATGETVLSQPGTLLELVCAKLGDPSPTGCRQGGTLQQQALDQAKDHFGGEAEEKKAEDEAAHCENCNEVGAFHWDAPAGKAGPSWAHAAGAIALAVLLTGAAAIFWRRRPRIAAGAESSQPLRAAE